MVSYSKDEREKVIKLTNQGKTVREIMEETGMSRAVIFRIKIDASKEEDKFQDRSLTVEVNVDYMSEALKELARAGKTELAKTITIGIINNPKVNEETKAIMQEVLLKIDILEDEFKEGRTRGKEVLNNKDVSDETKRKIKIKLITIEMIEKNFDQAKELAYEVLEEEGLTREEEIKVRGQLIEIAIREGNYELAINRALELLRCDDISKKTEGIIASRLYRMYSTQKRYKAARTVSKINLRENSRLNMIELLERDLSKTDNDKEKMRRLAEEERMLVERLEQSKPNSKQDTYEKPIKISEKRLSIYRNEISIEDINSLAEQNKDTLDGSLFIAEACAYLELQSLGSNCLKAYRKNNPNLEQFEAKTIAKSLELLKREGLSKQRLKEEWNKIYQYLEQSKSEEEILI